MKTIEDWVCYHVTYSGMVVPHQRGNFRECMSKAGLAIKIARHRGYPVSKIGQFEWEIETPERALSIGDFEGFLKVQPARDAPVTAR